MFETITTTLHIETCFSCGCIFGVAKDFASNRRRDHKLFYCPNGHSQYYPAKSAEDKLRDELQRERQQLDQVKANVRDLEMKTQQTRRRLYATKGSLTRFKNKVAAGKCPCCGKKFEDLHKHMADSHPTFVDAAKG